MVDNSIYSDQKDKYNFEMAGKPVLIENRQGIFYGQLEKADTRSGTALLRDGFMLSPERHITFTQYLDILADKAHRPTPEESDSTTARTMLLAESGLPREIIVKHSLFKLFTVQNSITDYATNGIFLVEAHVGRKPKISSAQATSKIISLSDVTAIVLVSANEQEAIVHELFSSLVFEDSYYRDSLQLIENLFDIQPNRIKLTAEDTFRYLLASSNLSNYDNLDLFQADRSAHILKLRHNVSLPKLVVDREAIMVVRRRTKNDPQENKA